VGTIAVDAIEDEATLETVILGTASLFSESLFLQIQNEASPTLVSPLAGVESPTSVLVHHQPMWVSNGGQGCGFDARDARQTRPGLTDTPMVSLQLPIQLAETRSRRSIHMALLYVPHQSPAGSYSMIETSPPLSGPSPACCSLMMQPVKDIAWWKGESGGENYLLRYPCTPVAARNLIAMGKELQAYRLCYLDVSAPSPCCVTVHACCPPRGGCGPSAVQLGDRLCDARRPSNMGERRGLVFFVQMPWCRRFFS